MVKKFNDMYTTASKQQQRLTDRRTNGQKAHINNNIARLYIDAPSMPAGLETPVLLTVHSVAACH